MTFEESLKRESEQHNGRLVVGSAINIWVTHDGKTDDGFRLDNMEEARRVERLIRAAPEMLAQLEKCRDFLMFNTGKVSGGSKMVIEIDSIIKKAKGQ